MTLEEFKTLRTGDKVKIIDTPVSETKEGIDLMDKWRGQIVHVCATQKNDFFGKPYVQIEEDILKDRVHWNWYPWMIEKKVEPDSDVIEAHFVPEARLKFDFEIRAEELEKEFAEFREQIKDELTRLKARLFDYMDKK